MVTFTFTRGKVPVINIERVGNTTLTEGNVKLDVVEYLVTSEGKTNKHYVSKTTDSREIRALCNAYGTTHYCIKD